MQAQVHGYISGKTQIFYFFIFIFFLWILSIVDSFFGDSGGKESAYNAGDLG